MASNATFDNNPELDGGLTYFWFVVFVRMTPQHTALARCLCGAWRRCGARSARRITAKTLIGGRRRFEAVAKIDHTLCFFWL